MKSRNSAKFIGIVLLGVLATPVWLAAQEQREKQLMKEHHRYRLVDLGTFGGPESYINPAFTFGSHNQINRGGSVVGGAATSIPTTPTSNGFICGGLDGTVPFVNHAFKWHDGAVTLGALGGAGNCSVGTSINARGDMVGRSENGLIDPVVGAKQVRAVLWKDGEIKDLLTLGGNGSSADAINNRGQVVGFSFNAIPDPLSIIYFGLAGSTAGTQTRAFLWEDGAMQDLGTLGGRCRSLHQRARASSGILIHKFDAESYYRSANDTSVSVDARGRNEGPGQPGRHFGLGRQRDWWPQQSR